MYYLLNIFLQIIYLKFKYNLNLNNINEYNY